MNLLDYQKSGNATGITVAPYPSFSLLDGLIPSVPGVLSYNDNLPSDYTYKSGNKLGSWLEATYGYKYDYCTYNGMLLEFYQPDYVFSMELNNLESELDGFRHSIGSFIYAFVPQSVAYALDPGSEKKGYYTAYNSGFIRNFMLPLLEGDVYSPIYLHELPKQYADNINFTHMRFSTSTEDMGSIQFDGDPLYYGYSSQYIYRNGKLFTDYIGNNYGLLPYKRHQFVCLFGEIKDGSGGNKLTDPGQSLQLAGLGGFNDQYRLFCEMTKMNFLSMFHTYNSKISSFNVYFPGEETPHKIKFNMNPPTSIKKRPFQTLFNYLGPGDLEVGGSIQTAKLQKYYDKYLTSNNILANIVASQGDENGKTFDKAIFAKQKEELYHIARETFRRLESTVFKDRSFQVEQDLEKFIEFESVHNPGHMGTDGVGTGASKKKLPFKEKSYVFNSGIAVNEEEAISISPGFTAVRPLKAVVNSVYNYLAAPWEQATAKLPKGGEIYIPPIFLAEGLGGAALDGDGLPQVNPKFLINLAHVLENCLPDKSYDKLEALADGFGAGKQTKVIFIPNEKYLQDLEDYKGAFPMYNEISFDIYPFAPSEIGMLLRKTKGLSEILSSLVSYYYAPKAKYDLARIKTEMFVLLGEEFANLTGRMGKMVELDIFQQAPGEQARKGKSLLPFTIPDYASIGAFYNPLEQFLSLINNPDNNLHYPDLFNNIIIDLGKYLESYLEQYIAVQEGESLSGLDVPIKDPEALDSYGVYKVLGPQDAAAISTNFISNGELNIEFMGSLNLILKEVMKKLSGIEEILSEKARYSEPFMYKIVKYDEEDNEIQTIFIPHFSNDSEDLLSKNPDRLGSKKRITYIDTQVRYGKYYKYKIKQLRLVVGADYRYIFSNNLNADYVAESLGYNLKLKDDLIMHDVLRNEHACGEMLEADTAIGSGIKTDFGFYTKTSDVDLESIKVVEKSIPVASDFGLPGSFHKHEEISDIKSFSREKLAIFETVVYPNFSLVEVPFYEQDVLVSDFPPIPPNVNFDPLIGKGPTLLMTFENQTGDREERPVLVEPLDGILFTHHKIAQKRINSRSIRFKSDDFPKAYQIFVLDTPPENYKSFTGKMALQLDVQQATAIQQSLVPNKTYYFMFRSVDIHDNVSNPSAVYAVQMTLDSGVYYPVVSIYNFQNKKIGTKSESFKQYAKIEAAMVQKIVNQEVSGISSDSSVIPDGHDLTLGIAGDSIWDQKKFKFRIKSKHTGKMIDLNVKFKNNYTAPPQGANTC